MLRFRPGPDAVELRITAILSVFLALVPYLSAQPIPVSQEHSAPAVSILYFHEKKVTIHADSEQKDKDIYHLRGQVQIAYEDMRMTSDEASFDDSTGDVIARGHVVFDDPRSHLEAEEVHYNIRTEKGWFSDGTGYVHSKGSNRSRVLRTENPFYISGQTVDRLNEDTYLVNHGTMTTCECAKKGWSLSVGQARVTPGDKAVAHNAVFRFLGVPIFYFPFMVDSIAREPRQTGFLLPHVGNSTIKGYIVGDGFFWAINPSADLTFGLEEYSKRGLAQRAEFRAKPTANSDFVVDFFGVMNDKYSGSSQTFDPANNSLTIVPQRAPGESIYAFGKDDDVGHGFRAVANVDYVNNMAFRLTWSPNFSQAVSSVAVQSGFISKNWDAYSFNVYAERYQDFLSSQLEQVKNLNTGAETTVLPASVVIQHLPSVEFDGSDRQIGNSPFYFSLETSADAVGRIQKNIQPALLLPLLADRLDFHPQLLLRPKEFWHFRFSPSVGFRATYYGDSLAPNHAGLTRVFFDTSLDLRPPSLEKVFARTYKGYRLKHVVEPDIQYHWVRARDPEDILNIIRFDPLDIFTETNDVEYSLTNTILARKDVGDNSPDTPQARDIFSWRLAQKYYFDPTFGGALVNGCRTVSENNPTNCQNYVFASTIDVTGFAFEHGQQFSPIDSVFKISPFSSFDTEIRTDVNPNGTGSILDAGITSRIRRGLLGVAVTDFFVNHSSYFGLLQGSNSTSPSTSLPPLTAFHLLGSVVTYGDPNRRGLSGAFGLDYNFQQRIFQHSVTQLNYNFGCFAINLEFQNYDLTTLRHETQFRIALALANVGTFGNLRPRERLSMDSPLF